MIIQLPERAKADDEQEEYEIGLAHEAKVERKQ